MTVVTPTSFLAEFFAKNRLRFDVVDAHIEYLKRHLVHSDRDDQKWKSGISSNSNWSIASCRYNVLFCMPWHIDKGYRWMMLLEMSEWIKQVIWWQGLRHMISHGYHKRQNVPLYIMQTKQSLFFELNSASLREFPRLPDIGCVKDNVGQSL